MGRTFGPETRQPKSRLEVWVRTRGGRIETVTGEAEGLLRAWAWCLEWLRK